ncbi:MAG: phosphoenolpyruvate synthase [Chloroflexi bacterium]|nr:MAG: phosphoenolpyruvate synthase [Chloroflexota bacterium]
MNYTLHFSDVDMQSLPLVGGKGASLGELSRAGLPVPEGFCVTTSAFSRFLAGSSLMASFFNELDQLPAEDLHALHNVGERLRDHLNSLPIPRDVETEVAEAWSRLGGEYPVAVRSSATAEDLPGASFAGQQDTYLNIIGLDSLIQHIRMCWASLFTDRAIVYRTRSGFDHRKVLLSVVVQRMIFPEVSGILFTADPISGNRNVTSIDASFGLGEALVSGIVSADLYQVKDNHISEKKVREKKVAIYGRPEGGTFTVAVTPDRANAQALNDQQIVDLARLGRQIENHYRRPQDIEWALAEDRFYILQSRPITTLFPLPQIDRSETLRVFISLGHQQMMTEAIRPLGMSVMRTFFPFGKPEDRTAESQVLLPAGNHMYIDLTDILHIPIGRKLAPRILKNFDDRMADAVASISKRSDFQSGMRNRRNVKWTAARHMAKAVWRAVQILFLRNPAYVIRATNRFMEDALAEARRQIEGAAEGDRIRQVRKSLATLPIHILFNVLVCPVTGMISLEILESLCERWLGDKEDVHELIKSVGDLTSEMGLHLGDLADVARNSPEIVALLRGADDKSFLTRLESLPEADRFREAFAEFMKRYGMRGPGEIDLTRPRWEDLPTQLVPALLGQIEGSLPGEHRRRFALGEQEARAAATQIIERAQRSAPGFLKAALLRRLIAVYRSMMSLREHDKYMTVRLFDIYRKVLFSEAARLVAAGRLSDAEDVYYLTLPEVTMLAEGTTLEKLDERIAARKAAYQHHQNLTPPRVMTSEGEVIEGIRNIGEHPAGALPGSPVSSGVVEGLAHVLHRPDEEQLNKGEILVAPHTDPAWTPLFLSTAGLVLEVGGLMTHGAVVAREYGIPAVVGVDGATEKIRTGQRIRVDGTHGWVEILEEAVATPTTGTN